MQFVWKGYLPVAPNENRIFLTVFALFWCPVRPQKKFLSTFSKSFFTTFNKFWCIYLYLSPRNAKKTGSGYIIIVHGTATFFACFCRVAFLQALLLTTRENSLFTSQIGRTALFSNPSLWHFFYFWRALLRPLHLADFLGTKHKWRFHIVMEQYMYVLNVNFCLPSYKTCLYKIRIISILKSFCVYEMYFWYYKRIQAIV